MDADAIIDFSHPSVLEDLLAFAKEKKIPAVIATTGLNEQQIEDIKTAVGEACKNICCHGSEGWAEEFQVECLIDDEKMEIYVKDNSTEHNVKKLYKPCLDCPNEGDLALFVITSLMDKLEIIKGENCKNTIKMVKEK